MTLHRDDFDHDALDELIRSVLIENLYELAMFRNEEESDKVLIDSHHRVIAYHSIPGTYMEGEYDV